jgi:hypothetical protein
VRKREGLGSVAAMVCFSGASTGPFYRHGRERERGHELGAVAGKLPVSGGSVADVWSRGWLGGVTVPPLALWQAR